MKKQFLLLLLMALLPLAGWAVDPTPIVMGDYTYTRSADIVMLGNPTATPVITVKKGTADLALTDGGIFDADKNKVDAIQTGGLYYKLVYFTDVTKKALYVPFYVATPLVPTRVNNAKAFNLELAEGGAYWYYYDQYKWADVWYQWGDTEADGVILYPGENPQVDAPYKNGDAYYPTSEQQAQANQWYEGLKDGDFSDQIIRSWNATGNPDSNPDNLVFSFYGESDDAWSVYVEYGNYAGFPWGEETVFGSNENQKHYGLISVAELNQMGGTTDFDAEGLEMFLLPTTALPDADLADVATIADATITINYPGEAEGYEYNGQEIYPDFSPNGDATVTIGEPTQEQTLLVENVDYVVTYADQDHVHAGVKNFTVTGIGAYEGEQASTYTILGKRVIINPAYTYKTYGQADPETPNFEIDAATELVPGEDPKEVIAPYLKLKRVNGQEGENVGAYLYYIDFAENYNECNYEIAILQNNSNLVIQKAPLTVHVTNYWKKFKEADPAQFDYEIVSGLTNGDTEVAVEITRTAGENVNAELVGNEAQLLLGTNFRYPFAGTAQNYTISFDNEFMIVPTEDIEGITVTVANHEGTAETNPDYGQPVYTYRGTDYEPGNPETDEANDLVVSDNGVILTAGTDYVVKEYKDNCHASTETVKATVTVTLMGSYASEDITGTFTIKKAKLDVVADSYELELGEALPDPLTWHYGGTSEESNNFVNGEDETTALEFVEPTSVTTTVLPGGAGYKLTVVGGSAADYEFNYIDGLASYGRTVLYVYADDKQKAYGAEDPELTWTVLDIDGNPATEAELEALGGDQPYFTIAREEGEDYGEYAITFDGPTVLPEGVSVVYVEGIFNINRKTVWLVGDDATKVYGDENPKFDASVYGSYENGKYGDKWSDEKKAEEEVINPDFYYVGVQGATWNQQQQRWILQSEDVTPGDTYYAVQPHLQGWWPNHITASGNYYVEVAQTPGKFTITPAPLTLTADDITKLFGTDDPELTVTAVGLKFEDEVVADDYTIVREEGEEVGDYVITLTLNENRLTNYTVTCENGTFSIVAGTLVVKANDQAISYGQAINPYDVTIYIDDEPVEWTEEQIAAILELKTEVTKVGANKDAYTLVPADQAHYEISEFINGWLTIAPLKEIPLDKAALAEITDIELKQVLEDHKGRTLDVILPGRKMDANEWYAWVLPFKVNQRDFFVDGKWGYGAMETLSETKTTATNVSFALTVLPIEANTPFIVKVDEDITAAEMKTMKFTGVKIDDSIDYLNENPTSGSDATVQFIGLYEENQEDLDNSTRVLMRNPDTGHMEFYPGGKVKAGQLVRTNAYLQFPTEEAAAAAHIYVEDPNGGGTTDISGVKTEANSMNAEGWYNLNGVKMEGAPTQKGVYIKDGKKVVIK